jgi:hypothetical protein
MAFYFVVVILINFYMIILIINQFIDKEFILNFWGRNFFNQYQIFEQHS